VIGLVFLASGGFFLFGPPASLLLGLAFGIGGLGWLGGAALIASEQGVLYEKGFVYHSGGEATVCRWDQIQDVHYQLTRHTSGWRVLFTTHLFTIHMHDGRKLRISSRLAKVEELGHRILTRTGRPIPLPLVGAGPVMFRPVISKPDAYELAPQGGDPSHPVTAAVLRAALEERPEFTVSEAERCVLELTGYPASPDAKPGVEAGWKGGNGRLTLRFPEPSAVYLEQLQLEADNAWLTAACCQALQSVFGPLCIRVCGAPLWLKVSESGDALPLDIILQGVRLDNPSF
jgi:hypothetical protein